VKSFHLSEREYSILLGFGNYAFGSNEVETVSLVIVASGHEMYQFCLIAKQLVAFRSVRQISTYLILRGNNEAFYKHTPKLTLLWPLLFPRSPFENQ